MPLKKIAIKCDFQNFTLDSYIWERQEPGSAVLLITGRESAAENIALTFAAEDLQVFVLSCADDTEGAACGSLGALEFLRSRAKSWNILPERLFVCGFGGGCSAALDILAKRESPSRPGGGILLLTEAALLQNIIAPAGTDPPPLFLWGSASGQNAANALAFAAETCRKGGAVEIRLHSGKQPETSGAAEAARWLRALPEKLGTGEKIPLEKPADALPEQYYENIYQDRASMFRHTPFALEQQLVWHVMQADEAAALQTLGSISRQGEKAVLAADPLRSAKNSVICSCAFLARAAIQAGVITEDAFALSDAAIQHIEKLGTKTEVLKYEADMLVQFIRLVRDRRVKSYSLPIQRAIHYIDAHLDRPIRLAELADYAKVHPSYLSRRFSQETGVTVGAYSIERKIQEGVYFVQCTDYSFAEIAALYGFSSQSQFIVSFKKVMGVTPGRFRLENKK
ncbi:MAG: AraC family transcriptional regulator [Oscillospiraceae bacterium]|jgi:AraC-like DNA-binding protein/predicted esterase|nr:AraC family transcriptional regulator [Oscillospiraceae bacterium]